MTISKLATEVWPLAKTADGYNRFYKRPDKPKGFIVHHAATTFDSALKAAFVNPTRVLSANYAMRKDGTIVAVLHEEYRPFTSASPKADNWGVTIEIVNQSGAPDWPLSEHQLDQLAKLVGDNARRWGWNVSRETVIGHWEVLGKFGQGYATACPGPWMRARMDVLVKRAAEYAGQVADTPTPPPAPSRPTPSTGGVKIGSTLRLSRWRGYTSSSLSVRQSALLSGDFEVIGIAGGNFKIKGGGRVAWVHGSASAGLVAAIAPAPPAPTPVAKPQLRIGATVRLATPWTAFMYWNLTGRMRKNLPPGDYRVDGIKGSGVKLEGNGREAWVHRSVVDRGGVVA